MQYEGVAYGQPIVVVVKSEGLEFCAEDAEDFRKWSALESCSVTDDESGTASMTLTGDGKLTIDFPDVPRPEVHALARQIHDRLGSVEPAPEEKPEVAPPAVALPAPLPTSVGSNGDGPHQAVTPTAAPTPLRKGLSLLRRKSELLVAAMLVVASGWLVVAMIVTLATTFSTTDLERAFGIEPSVGERLVRFLSGSSLTLVVFVHFLGIAVAVRLGAAVAEASRGESPRTWRIGRLGTPSAASTIGRILSAVLAAIAILTFAIGSLIAIWAGVESSSVGAFLFFIAPTAMATLFTLSIAAILSHLSRAVARLATAPYYAEEAAGDGS